MSHLVWVIDIDMAQDLITRLVYKRRAPIIGKICYLLLKMLGVEIPRSVQVGKNLEIAHGGFGIVIHPWTQIGDNVKIYPGVTIGRGDVYRSIEESRFKGVIIGDGVILSSGCKVLGEEGTLIVGSGSIIGANAVLLDSTGENEIWVGVPARKVGFRTMGR